MENATFDNSHEYAPREVRIAYLIPQLCTRLGWMPARTARHARAVLDDVGGYGGLTNAAWLDRAEIAARARVSP